MKSLIVLLAVLVASPAAFAQPGAAAPAQPAMDRKEKIKKRIRALRAYTLTEELSLDEQTAGKLFPLLAKYDDEFDKLLVARTDLQRRLEASASEKDSKVLDKLIDDALANQKGFWTAEENRLQQLRKILTPAQTARVLVVLPTMERKIQNQLKRVVQQQQPQAPMQQPTRRRPRAGSADGGELGGNPFGRRDGDVVDPFSAPHVKQKKKAYPAKPDCDPFSDRFGCTKTDSKRDDVLE